MYQLTDRERDLLQITFSQPTGSSEWITAQQELHDHRLDRASAMLDHDPYSPSQDYFDMVLTAEGTYEKLVRGCLALANRRGITAVVHEIRAANLSEFNESMLLDSFTRSAY